MKVEPQSGSLLVGFIGTENFAILNCSIFAGSEKQFVVWSVQNFRSNAAVQKIENATAPELFCVTNQSDHHNVFTQSHFLIRNLNSDLDSVTIFCGTERKPQLANFTLKVYRKCIA